MREHPEALDDTNGWMIPPNKHIVLRTSYIKMALKCSAQALFRYHKGIIEPPRSYATFGTSMHKSAEYQNKYKLRKGSDARLSVLQDVFNESWKERASLTRFTQEEKPEQIREYGIKKALPVYYEKLAKRVDPLYVEEPFAIEFKEVNASITGTIDLVTTRHVIRDLKNKSRSPNWLESIKSTQGVSYWLGYQAKFKKNPSGFVLDTLIKKATPEMRSSEIRMVTPEDTRQFINLVYKIVLQIRRGVFLPQRENNMFCSPQMCGYWNRCTKKGEWMDLPKEHRLFMGNDGDETTSEGDYDGED